MKKVGLITIHGINNFGSLLQAYATQKTIEMMGYKCEIINYMYPNEYHLKQMKVHNPYAVQKLSFIQRVKAHFYNKYVLPSVVKRKTELFKRERERLLKLTECYESKESLIKNPPHFDIYMTGSDQVWNPRYLYDDTTFFLPFIRGSKKIAYSASFGSTEIDERYQRMMRPLLSDYQFISTREESGVRLIRDICGRQAVSTCDPTLLLSAEEWKIVFNDPPLVKGNYILCYVLTYTANPYPYAYELIKYIKKQLKMKVVFIDETGKYWCDIRNKSIQTYGPRDIINLFQNASFIVSSSFHGTAFSINFRKDFYSIFPRDVKDERQESLLARVGALDRLIRVDDKFPEKERLYINNWDEISKRLEDYVALSKNYLISALEL